MSNQNRPGEHTLRARRAAARVSRRPARRPRAQLIADAVIANYIHDISVRHRGPATSRPAAAGRLPAVAR